MLLSLPGLAEGSFPGKNGKIAIVRSAPGSPLNGIWTVNQDGSDLTFLTDGGEPAWSPDGAELAFRRHDGIYVSKADGSQATRIVAATDIVTPAWSPDGSQLIYVKFGACDPDGFCNPGKLIKVKRDGSGATPILTAYAGYPDWSPDGSEIAFQNCPDPGGCQFGGDTNIWVVNAAGGGLRQLSFGDEEIQPAWSPNAQKIVYEDRAPGNPSQPRLETRNRDGSGVNPINPTLGRVRGVLGAPSWSPDGSLIATPYRHGPCEPNCGSSCNPGSCFFDLFLVAADESGVTRITNLGDVRDADWQPVPNNGYPRPKDAAVIEVSMVPAYNPCSSPNREHGPPLGFGSCNPPAKASDESTLGTPDANARPVKGSGLVRYGASRGDVKLNVEAYDVYDDTTLADYTRELRLRTPLRITDKQNALYPGGTMAATVSDTTLGTTVPCATTADSTTGATCLLETTFNALMPGAVPSGKRSVWALGQVQIDDGGADGDADTAADNTLFMVQGVFVP